MRDPVETQRLSVTVWLMIVITVAFAFQQISAVYSRVDLSPWLELSTAGLRKGYLWQLLTFQFLHANLWHLIFNLIGLWSFGRIVEDRLGKAHLLKLYFFSGILGGVLHGLLGLIFPGHFGLLPVVGASAGVFALIAAFGRLAPENEILLCFVVPVKGKFFLMIAGGIALFFTIVPSDPLVAHAAHLGGLLGGLAYVAWGIRDQGSATIWHPLTSRLRRRQLVKAASVRQPAWRATTEPDHRELPTGDFISQEVDPILDKISAQGIHSLTERERKILEAARAKMSGK